MIGEDAPWRKHSVSLLRISGASGVIYGCACWEILKELNIESHLIITKAAEMTLAYETTLKSIYVKKSATIAYNVADIWRSLRQRVLFNIRDDCCPLFYALAC